MADPIQLPALPESQACAWMQGGEMVNAFNWPARPFSDYDRAYWGPKGYSRAPLFDEAALHAYGLECRKQGLEDAARVCDGLVHALDNAGVSYHRPASEDRCARAIRSLLLEPPKGMGEGGGND